MLWNRRNISELLKLALQPVAGKPPPSQNKEQLLFDFDWHFSSKIKIWQKCFWKIGKISAQMTEKCSVFWKIMGFLWYGRRKKTKKIWQAIKPMLYYETIMRGRAVVAYQAHNLKVSGSIPLPATKWISASQPTGFFCAVKVLTTKGFAKERKFSKNLLGLRSLGEGVSDSPFFSKTERYVIQRMSFYNSLNNTK